MTLNQIVIECVTEEDGSLAWVWDAWPLEDGKPIASGCAGNLHVCIESMRWTLKEKGYLP